MNWAKLDPCRQPPRPSEQTREHAGAQVKISQRDEVLRTTILQGVKARLPGAVVVQVPAALDQLERVASDIGAQISPAAATAVDERLSTRPETITELLEQCLEDRPLIVDGRDLVGDLGTGIDPILQAALRDQVELFGRFLDQRACCIAVSANPKQPFADGRARLRLRSLGTRALSGSTLAARPKVFSWS